MKSGVGVVRGRRGGEGIRVRPAIRWGGWCHAPPAAGRHAARQQGDPCCTAGRRGQIPRIKGATSFISWCSVHLYRLRRNGFSGVYRWIGNHLATSKGHQGYLMSLFSYSSLSSTRSARASSSASDSCVRSIALTGLSYKPMFMLSEGLSPAVSRQKRAASVSPQAARSA